MITFDLRSLPQVIVIAIMSLFIIACSPPVFKKADGFKAQGEWLKAVHEYRQILNENPDDIELKMKLKQAELFAADYYYLKGMDRLEKNDTDGAIFEFQRGLSAMRNHAKLQQSMLKALSNKESQNHYNEGVAYLKSGNGFSAKASFIESLKADPNNNSAIEALNKIKSSESKARQGRLALSSTSPITLNFRDSSLKTAFEFIVRAFGVNVIFDEGVKGEPVTLFAKNVTFEQALNLLLTTTKTFYKKVGPNTILIAPDNANKRGQYEDYIIQTFHLSSIGAKSMADIIKGVIDIKKVIINEQLNSILVRDTAEKVQLVRSLVEANDRKPAEIIMDVEILEINRTQVERLGLDFGQRITETFPEYPVANSLTSTLKQGVITLPQITFDYFKQDVDAKTLANPKIRVIDGKEAKIHIGDRVPLRSSTVQDTTGQVRYTYDYKEIGIRLTVAPNIHLDDSSTVKLGLEVSSLGANLGTDDEPAYSIGTRNAETHMLLRDGETAILGGLIRDEERRNRVKVPGLGDIPLVGALFTSYDDSQGRTDVLLTITPRVVRSWDLPEKEKLSLYSGTENTYSNNSIFGYMNVAQSDDVTPEFMIGSENSELNRGNEPSITDLDSRFKNKFHNRPSVSFSEEVYSVKSGEVFEFSLNGVGVSDVESLALSLLFDSKKVEFVESTSEVVSHEDGVISLSTTPTMRDDNSAELTTITMKGIDHGSSYLILRTEESENDDISIQVKPSRVHVK